MTSGDLVSAAAVAEGKSPSTSIQAWLAGSGLCSGGGAGVPLLPQDLLQT